MAKSKYEFHIKHDHMDKDASLLLARFPAVKSQFDNPPDQIHLSLRPKSLKARLEVDLLQDSVFFSKANARRLAEKSLPGTFSYDLADKNFYNSTKDDIEDGQLFVGQIVNDKLVCRPISHILTFRSDFSHFDLKDEVDIKEEVKPISVKFAAPERHGPIRARGDPVEEEDPKDAPRPIKFKNSTSREAATLRKTLFGQHLPKVKQDPDAEPMDCKPILPDIKPKVEMDLDEPAPEPSDDSIKPAYIKNQVRSCLIKAKLVTFDEVYQFLRSDMNDTTPSASMSINSKDILDALSDLAVLVQGVWAVKSDVLYGDSSQRESTDVTGISINLFIAARDYLLWLFTQNRFVKRYDYCRKVKIPDHDALELFNQLAELRKNSRRWEFKLPTDDKFIEKYPDVVQRQATFWKVRRANKLNIFN